MPSKRLSELRTVRKHGLTVSDLIRAAVSVQLPKWKTSDCVVVVGN